MIYINEYNTCRIRKNESGQKLLTIYIYIYIRKWYIMIYINEYNTCWIRKNESGQKFLTWSLSQSGFDPSYGEILSSHTDEFW